MRGKVSKWIGLSLAMLLSLAIAAQVYGQGRPPKQGTVAGVVQNVSKDSSTITVRKGSVPKQVLYTNDTKFTYRGQASSLDEVKDGRRVRCTGTYNEKTQLVATQVDVRSGK